MDTQTLVDEREAEKQRLAAAIDEFAADMKARAFQKVDEGYLGWDDPDGWLNTSPITRLHNEAVQLIVGVDAASYDRKCVDAGMFAMFARFISRRQRGVESEG